MKEIGEFEDEGDRRSESSEMKEIGDRRVRR